MWIDPANGTILRVSLVADLKGNPTLESGAILVEYGPVRMQGQTFMCPLRSLALSNAAGGVSATLNGTATEWLNENLFADYHLFASTSRILTGEADSSPSQTPATAPDSGATASATPPVPAIASSSHPPKETSAAGQPPIDLQVPPSPAPATAPPNELAVHNADVPVTPSPLVSARASQPDQRSAEATPRSQAAPDSRTPDAGAAATFHLNVNAVLVPVVVRDGHGRSVTDLRKEDFEVFDNGKPRLLSGFLVEKGGLAQKALNSQGAEAGNSRGAAQSQIVLPGRVTVFVFDDLDMDSEDIEHAQVAVSKVLDAALTGSDIAAVVDTSGRVNSGLTRDRAELDRALRAVRPSPIYRSAADCPKVGYYQADLIVNKHNENALQDVIQQIMWVCDPNTPDYVARRMAQASANAALALGQQGVHATYDSISEYVRRIAKLPGQHNMILLSSGFLPIEQDGRYAESALMNLAADSNVTIDAIDARGLYTTYLGAGNDTRGRDPNLVANLRDSEMRAEENAMGELAHATGGDFFHNNNDLESGLTELLNAPETVYVLELPMDVVKANGAYHQLKVSVDRADVQVQARKGYVAPRDEQARPRN